MGKILESGPKYYNLAKWLSLEGEPTIIVNVEALHNSSVVGFVLTVTALLVRQRKNQAVTNP